MSDQITALQNLAAGELSMTNQQIKPLVLLPGKGVQIRDTASEIYKLASARKTLFYSNGMVMKIGHEGPNNLPSLIPLSPAAAMSEFEKYARLGKAGGKDKDESFLNEGLAKAILHCDAAKDILHNVRGLLNYPLPVIHKGQFEILHKGYNDSTSLFVAGGHLTEPDTVEEAVELIEQILADFSFQSDSDISRAIACFLSPALKIGGFIHGNTPIDIIEANESQTGKGFFLNLRCLLYGETPILIAKQQGGVGSTDESFSSALLTGRPFIQFDNIRGELKSQYLEAFSTNPGSISVRTPYSKSQTVDGSLRFISITSNDMITTEDLANRASFVRLEKDRDREFARTEGKTIDELIRFARPNFIGAVTKIIRHYFDLGMPRTNERRHSFLEWAQKLDWIVQHIFKKPPLMDDHMNAQERIQNPALVFLRALTIQVSNAKRLGEHFRANDLVALCETNGLEVPGAIKGEKVDSSGKQGAQRMGQIMSQAFMKADELTLDQFMISREKARGYSDAGNTFTSSRYTFERIVKETAEGTEPESTTSETAEGPRPESTSE